MKLMPRNFRLKVVAGELNPNVNILSELIGSTENEFLFVGEKLLDFHQRASDVASMTTEAVKHIAGKEMGSIIENFKIVLAMAESLNGGFATEKDILKSILTDFSQIRSPLIGFEKVVRNLNILCNFIKIEIACLGRSDTGFNTLADDVRRIAYDIGTKTANLVLKTDSLSPLITENLFLVDNLGSKNEDQAKIILQNIVKNIRMLTEKTNLSANSMKEVAETWKKISGNMAEVVESMQFHDITRQRFEHAHDALKELPHKIYNNRKEGRGWYKLYHLFKNNSDNGNGTSKSKYEEVDLIADTCDLQSAQLRHARDAFVAAVVRILESLNNIAGHAGSMSTEIYEITGSGNDRKGSFILELEQDIGYLEDCITECMQLNKDLSEAMLKAAKTASGMSVFMKEMETLSIEMQVLALNARVHAAHLGDSGATLGVLADAIHSLATETTTQVGFISLKLKDVVSNAENLATKANSENLIVQEKAAKIKDNLEQIIEPIKKIDDEINLLLPRIDQAGKMLADDIGQLTASVTIHNRVGENIENIVLCLSNISGKVKPDKTASRRRDDHLEDLAKRYTMNSERETHLGSSKPAPSEMPQKTAAPSSVELPAETLSTGTSHSKEDDLGDNVDLF
jgi:methyl-accepting chemotaxis protein